MSRLRAALSDRAQRIDVERARERRIVFADVRTPLGRGYDDRIGHFPFDERGDGGGVANVELHAARVAAAVRGAHDLPAFDIREFLGDRAPKQPGRADQYDLQTRVAHHAPAADTTV